MLLTDCRVTQARPATPTSSIPVTDKPGKLHDRIRDKVLQNDNDEDVT